MVVGSKFREECLGGLVWVMGLSPLEQAGPGTLVGSPCKTRGLE